MSGITLCSRDPGTEQRLQGLVGDETVFRRVWSDAWRDTVEATMDLCAADPELVLIGNDVHIDTTMALVVEAYRRFPRSAVIVLLPGEDTATAVELWRLGARDVVDISLDDTLLANQIRGILEEVRYRRNVSENEGQTRHRKIIVVLSPKGGTGKTTLAVNMAVGLAHRRNNQVLLVDLDTQFGDCAATLGVEPDHSLVQAMATPNIRRSALKVFLTTHHSSLSLLSPPDDLSASESIDPDDLKNTLTALAEEFPYVVIDTAAGIDPACVVAMNLATDFLFVSTTDVPSIKAVRRQLDALDRIGYNKQQRTFILNRANAKVGLTVSNVESAVGLPAAFQIRSSRAVPMATNQGTPIIESKSGPVAKSFEAIAEYFAPGKSS